MFVTSEINKILTQGVLWWESYLDYGLQLPSTNLKLVSHNRQPFISQDLQLLEHFFYQN